MISPLELDRSACLRRLGSAQVGRLVYSVNCLPAARPVGLALSGPELRVALGHKIDPADLHPGDVVAIEIDDAAPLSSATWSVTATGLIMEVLGERREGRASSGGAIETVLRVSLDQLDGYEADSSG